MSISNFVAPRVVGVIYGLSILGVILAVFGVVVSAFTEGMYQNFFFGLVYAVGASIVSIIVAVVYLLFVRVALEALVAGIITAQNTNEIKDYVRQIRNENP